MFYGWLQCGLCERWDLYSIYSHPKAWIISDFGSIGNMANISHLTFMLHGVKDGCLKQGKCPNCVEGAKKSLAIISGKNSWTFQPKNQIVLYARPHLRMLRRETSMKSLGFDTHIPSWVHVKSFLWFFAFKKIFFLALRLFRVLFSFSILTTLCCTL